MDTSVSDLSIEPLGESKFVKPFSIVFTQDGKRRRWDCVEAHDSVSCVLYHTEKHAFLFVRQFRPSLWYYQTRGGEVGEELGVSNELCAGIMDKGLSPEKTIIEEVLEETGYEIEAVSKITSSYTALGFGANKQTIFYALIDESMRRTKGGGVDDEKIECIFVPESEIMDFIFDERRVKAPNLQFGILWFTQNILPTIQI